VKFGEKIFFSIFCLGGPRGKKIEFSKISPNQMIFCTRGFSGMGNTNPKEFFDFERIKGPNQPKILLNF
jgi:hypothetical protein